jgi:dCTP deaminase
MLGSKKILQEYKKGNINIYKFNLDNLKPNSYDVRLGQWVIRKNSQSSKLYPGESNKTLMFSTPINLFDKRIDGDLVIEPFETLLAHTEEIVGSEKYAMLLKSRSTLARIGLDICASAGFGDVGYNNRWTLEITNNTNDYIVLRPKMRVAQISFFNVDGIGKLYNSVYNFVPNIIKFKSMTDQDRTHYNEIILKEWNPKSMLPKLGPERMF